jgi:hypothetical protein
VAPTAGDALVMALHAVDTMAGLGKHKFVDTVVTGAAFEAVRMVRIVAGHDGFVKDGLVTDATAVRTIRTDRLTVGKEKEIGVGSDPVVTLGALEAVDVKEGLSMHQGGIERRLEKMQDMKRRKLTRTR